MTDRAARIYLDHNASAPLRAVAREAMLGAMEIGGNPSSVHAEGRAARVLLEDARRAIAEFSGVAPGRVVFTSGASEAASTLLASDWLDGADAHRFDRLAVCAADHPALRSGGRFDAGGVTRIGVDAAGRLDLAEMERWLASGGTPLVALAAANGETGTVQDIEGIGERVRRAGGRLVVDASQIAGRGAMDAARADATILSSHKLGGPKGIGAIVLGSSTLQPRPLIAGGPQETRRRAGTPAPMLAAGFAAAAREATTDRPRLSRMGAMRDAFERDLTRRVPVVVLGAGAGAERLPQTSAFQVAGHRAETVQIAADLAGIAISAGAACQSGKLGHSDALDALHAAGARVDPALGFVRASFGTSTTEADLRRLLELLVSLPVRATDSMHRAA